MVTHRNVALATGRDWVDALAGGSIAGLNNALLLLTDGTSLPDGQTQYLGPQEPTKVNDLLVFGGPSAVPARAIAAFESATGVNGWSYAENRFTSCACRSSAYQLKKSGVGSATQFQMGGALSRRRSRCRSDRVHEQLGRQSGEHRDR